MIQSHTDNNSIMTDTSRATVGNDTGKTNDSGNTVGNSTVRSDDTEMRTKGDSTATLKVDNYQDSVRGRMGGICRNATARIHGGTTALARVDPACAGLRTHGEIHGRARLENNALSV